MSDNRSALLKALESAQRESWSQGEKVLVETFLDSHPELSGDRESLLQLILQEHRLRLAAGESPTLDEYRERFPQLADDLSELLVAEIPPPEDDAATKTFPSGGQKTKKIVCPFCSTNLKSGTTRGPIQCDNCGQHVHIPEETAPIQSGAGRRIGAFELISSLGMGQYGEVWRANDTQLRREVAIKIPRNRDSSNATLNMFLREARAVARLRHPNIVTVYEAGRHEDLVYIVSAYINGTNLKHVLSNKRLKFDEAAALCASIATALDHAHQAGIVHRDLKPSNVLIDTQGVPYIADFGLAKHAALDEITLTSNAHILGTPAYMSPEQARGDAYKAGPASDIYSLGVMLYEMLTGTRPFVDKPEVLSYRIMTEPPRPPRSINKQAPADLETICLKALEKLPSDRYATAQDMADDLNRFLRGELIHARPATLLQKSARWTRRNAVRVGGAGLVAGLGGLLFASYVAGPHTERPQRRRTRITSFPIGARLSFLPVDSDSGQPQAALLRQAQANAWAELDLLPGDYLVVAEFPNGQFHEAWRHVPNDEELAILPRAYPHLGWKIAGDAVELNRIFLEVVPNTEGMARFEATERFTVGRADERVAPYWRTIPAFYLDATEVTVGAYRKRKGLPRQLLKDPPPDDYPVTFVSYHEAVNYAEAIGKRLPDEFEYEYAATMQGTRHFPWGNDLSPTGETWMVGSVMAAAYDRLPTVPPVMGLCSNAGEWTASAYTLNPSIGGGRKLPAGKRTQIVRGTSNSVLSGGPLMPEDGARLTSLRVGQSADSWKPALGFRCARSVRPRLTASDFSKLLENSGA